VLLFVLALFEVSRIDTRHREMLNHVLLPSYRMRIDGIKDLPLSPRTTALRV
ncbi:hypothetical protein SK128_019542, partial [Halocaridina rubra]